MIELKDVRIKDGFLHHRTLNIISPIPIPLYSIRSTNKTRFYHENGQLFARTGEQTIRLVPAYCAKRMKIAGSNKDSVSVSVLASRYERHNALGILLDHYMGVPNNGLVVAMYLNDTDEVIGCGVVNRLTYANPKGREDIALKEGIRPRFPVKWHEANRRDVIESLNVAWLSRIAIAKKYQGKGFGTILAEELSIIAGESLIPPAAYIEVITSAPKEKAQKIISDTSNSLFVKAGYTMHSKLLPSPPMCFLDNDGTYTEQQTTKKIYYYKKAGRQL